MRVLAIDVGSSAVKAALWNKTRFASRVRVEFPTAFQGVRVEAPADKVLAAVRRAGREAMRGLAGGVDVISFCAFSSGLVVTDQRGRIRAGAITHQDRRSVNEAQQLVDRLGKTWLLDHTANLPYPGGIASSTLAWIRKHQPAALRGDVRIGQVSSLIAWMITGQWTIDPSQAVFLGLWDIRKRNWSGRMCDAVGICAECLPRVVWAQQVLGRTAASISHAWGLKEGTPVVGGLVDTSAATIQAPMKPGQLVHASGSTDVLSMCLLAPKPAEGILTRPVGLGGAAERWTAVRTIAAAGSALDWVRRTMFAGAGDASWRQSLHKSISRANESGLPSCSVHFSGQRATIAQQPGASFAGITLATSREDLLASVVQGLVRESVRNYQLLRDVHPPRKTVFAMGGAGALAGAMHSAWGNAHPFQQLPGDGLSGLVKLAQFLASSP